MKRITSKVHWKKMNGLVPAVVQHAKTGMVLMLAYMNEEALRKTLKSKKVWFYSRSKKRLWMKGEKSRNILMLQDIKLDCDGDALLVKALPKGPTCHTGDRSCFKGDEHYWVLQELFDVIESRKKEMPKDSYTTFLFEKGLEKICQKIEEESDEVILAAKEQSEKRLTEESVDLIYHLLVLLVQRHVHLEDVLAEAAKRRKQN